MTYIVNFYSADKALGETYWPGSAESARRHAMSHMESSGATRSTIRDAAGDLVFEHTHDEHPDHRS